MKKERSIKTISVKSYSEPSYPTRSVLDDHPELMALVPVRWRANPVVIAALTGLCLMMSAYKSHAASTGAPPASRVAPVFQHGNGRASYGCVATAAPVFLSEDEARSVIEDEARKAGITFAHDSKIVTVEAQAEKYGWTTESKPRPGGGVSSEMRWETHKQPRTIKLTLDGTNKTRNISYEFVSKDDYKDLNLIDPNNLSTVYVYDYAKTAKLLRDGLEKAKPEGAYGVFYDPVFYNTGKRRADDPRGPLPTSADELRNQVRDFIKWLKVEGVI